MTSGESVVLALQKENAVADWRTLIGKDPNPRIDPNPYLSLSLYLFLLTQS